MIEAVFKPKPMKRKPMKRTDMWDALTKGTTNQHPGISSGVCRPTRAQFFKWLREMEKTEYLAGWNDGVAFGMRTGYQDGHRDGVGAVRDNY